MKLLSLLGAILVSATSFGAQMGFGGGTNVNYLPVLLFNPKVQQDMHLSPAVAQQEQSLIMQLGMQMLPMAQKAGSQTPESRRQILAAYKNMEDKTIAPLTPAQRVRLHQLTLQFLGPNALAMPNVADQVGLTKAQKAKVAQIAMGGAMAMRSHMPTGGADATAQFGAMGKSMHEARAVEEKQIDKVLTPAQKAKWSSMQGRKLPGVTDFGGMGM